MISYDFHKCVEIKNCMVLICSNPMVICLFLFQTEEVLSYYSPSRTLVVLSICHQTTFDLNNLTHDLNHYLHSSPPGTLHLNNLSPKICPDLLRFQIKGHRGLYTGYRTKSSLGVYGGSGVPFLL